jgi:hypothetical protein
MTFKVGMTLYDSGCKCTQKDMSNQVTMTVVSTALEETDSLGESNCISLVMCDDEQEAAVDESDCGEGKCKVASMDEKYSCIQVCD